MTEAFLRRRPKSSDPHRSRIVRRFAWAGVGVLVFAVLDARGATHVTQLTREIQEAKSKIMSLESELGYVVRLEGAMEGREAALAALERESGFVAPDSGCVVEVRPREPVRRPGR